MNPLPFWQPQTLEQLLRRLSLHPTLRTSLGRREQLWGFLEQLLLAPSLEQLLAQLSEQISSLEPSLEQLSLLEPSPSPSPFHHRRPHQVYGGDNNLYLA
jgi:hypothetical protein